MFNIIPQSRNLEAKGVRRRSFILVVLSFILLSLSFSSTAQNTTEVAAPISLYVNANGNGNNSIQGLTPSQVRHAYGFDQIANQGKGQTIGISIPLHNPNI